MISPHRGVLVTHTSWDAPPRGKVPVRAGPKLVRFRDQTTPESSFPHQKQQFRKLSLDQLDPPHLVANRKSIKATASGGVQFEATFSAKLHNRAQDQGPNLDPSFF